MQPDIFYKVRARNNTKDVVAYIRNKVWHQLDGVTQVAFDVDDRALVMVSLSVQDDLIECWAKLQGMTVVRESDGYLFDLVAEPNLLNDEAKLLADKAMELRPNEEMGFAVQPVLISYINEIIGRAERILKEEGEGEIKLVPEGNSSIRIES